MRSAASFVGALPIFPKRPNTPQWRCLMQNDEKGHRREKISTVVDPAIRPIAAKERRSLAQVARILIADGVAARTFAAGNPQERAA
jgi:hypothetical protein